MISNPENALAVGNTIMNRGPSGRTSKLVAIAGAMLTVLIALPAKSAEQIIFSYGPLEFPVTLQDLESFAVTGELKGGLGTYLRRFNPRWRLILRQGLQTRYRVNPVMVAQFAYTASGERLLTEAGQLIQMQTGQNGFYSLRAAGILAASDPEGLTLLNALRKLPTNMRIDISQLLRLGRQLSSLGQQTQRTVARLEQQTAAIAKSEPNRNLAPPLDPLQPGPFQVAQQTLTLHDPTRDRILMVQLFQPQANGKFPIIVVSNGLGSAYTRFEALAQHLASHGFAIAIPNHPGSDDRRLRNFYAGLYRENFEAKEYLDRPLDITFLLNELERLNTQRFAERLNLQQVGVFGYSFGGSTALTLAGAKLNFAQLKTDCATQVAIVNISLLYQCRALELSSQLPPLHDQRVKAIYAYLPFGKSLFGQTEIQRVQLPIFWQATDQDILTPLLIEQVPVFQWLTTPNRYFALTQGLPHARVTFEVLQRSSPQSKSWDELRAVLQRYQNALSVAFFKVYLAQDDQYRPFLQATYAQRLTQAPYQLSLVQSITN
jgi:predicted dienelactone hydrolase